MKTIVEPQRETPVFTEADVIVVGGGPGGIGAALAAARNGAKTILIERYAFLGGMQTQCFNPSFAFIDAAVQGGIIQDVINRLRKVGAVTIDQTDERSRIPNGWACVWFDPEYYKYLLDTMMQEAGIKLLYHAFGAGAVKEGNTIKGIIIESKEGRQAVLGKVVIDSTGSADIAWQSGTPCTAEGIPSGPKKGRHSDYSYAFFLREVNFDRYRAFRKEHVEEWGSNVVGRSLIKQAKAEGKLYGSRGAFMISAYSGTGRLWVMGPQYPLPMGHHGWLVEDLTNGEIDLRKQAWSAYNLLKENVPGFENSHMDQTPTHLQLRDTHRIVGGYVLKYEDILKGKSFDDSIAVNNMSPDVFGADAEHEHTRNTLLFDIPYRCLVPQETDNLLAAGMIISTDFITQNAIRQCTPSICTGQAAGTAAALAVKNKISPRKLDVELLQKTLRKQGARITVKDVPGEVQETYRKRAEQAVRTTLAPE
ncbi:MAG TPA: FAD-dependent oxidoreductase [Dehalococcoidales bacterium]